MLQLDRAMFQSAPDIDYARTSRVFAALAGDSAGATSGSWTWPRSSSATPAATRPAARSLRRPIAATYTCRPRTVVAAAGLTDVVIVDTPDAVLGLRPACFAEGEGCRPRVEAAWPTTRTSCTRDGGPTLGDLHHSAGSALQDQAHRGRPARPCRCKCTTTAASTGWSERHRARDGGRQGGWAGAHRNIG